jgi:hypothetical protein
MRTKNYVDGVLASHMSAQEWEEQEERERIARREAVGILTSPEGTYGPSLDRVTAAREADGLGGEGPPSEAGTLYFDAPIQEVMTKTDLDQKLSAKDSAIP